MLRLNLESVLPEMFASISEEQHGADFYSFAQRRAIYVLMVFNVGEKNESQSKI